MAALFVGVLGAGCGYNRIVNEEQQVEAAWGQVESQLQRRADLVPNLVETVKGYAKHEKAVFDDIASARSAMMGAGSRAESYPQLKADQNYARLMDELAGTENRLAVARNRYNDAVQRYNADVRGIPGAWWAKIGGFPAQKEYFKADAASRAAPKVSFQ